jgi:hypothetical protein
MINLASEVHLRVNEMNKIYSLENPHRRNLMGDPNIDGMMMMMMTKQILREIGWTGSEEEPMVISEINKYRTFLNKQTIYQLLNKGSKLHSKKRNKLLNHEVRKVYQGFYMLSANKVDYALNWSLT